MYVTPTKGRNVPDPARGDTLPPEGREVEPTQYWQRRIVDGDVVETNAVADSQVVAASQADSQPNKKES